MTWFLIKRKTAYFKRKTAYLQNENNNTACVSKHTMSHMCFFRAAQYST